MKKNSVPTTDRGMSIKTNAAVLDRHFPPRAKAPRERRILPVSKEVSRTSASDRLPDLLQEPPSAPLRKETEKPRRSPVDVPSKSKAAKPKKSADPKPANAPAKESGLLTCPTPRNDESMLLRQSIPMSHCEQRQAKSYHKCANCSFAKGRQFKGVGLPPLDNSPAHLQHARLLGLFGPDGEWLRP